MKILYSILFLIVSCFSKVNGSDSGFLNLDTYTETDRRALLKSTVYTDPVLAGALYQVAQDAKDVFEEQGIEYWISFGTLLGAVRNEGLLPWDDDLDFSFDKKQEAKLWGLKDLFSRLGYNLLVDQENIVGYKLYRKSPITLKDGKKVLPFLDLFMCEDNGEKFILSCERGRQLFKSGPIARDQVLTKQRYKFGPMELWGATNPERYLVESYTSNWNKQALVYFLHTQKLRQKYIWTLTAEDRIPPEYEGVVEKRYAILKTQDFWNDFYKNKDSKRTPSTFATFLMDGGFLRHGQSLVDFGCGDGRDAFFFASKGLKVIGVDGSKEAIAANTEFSRINHLEKVSFLEKDVMDLNSLNTLRANENFYARFFMHAISPTAQENMLTFFESLEDGARIFLEFRTDKDPKLQISEKLSQSEGIADGHYRRFINFEAFCATLKAKGFQVSYARESQGWSVHKGDDPVLGRIIALRVRT